MSKGINSVAGVNPGDIYTTNGRDLWRVQVVCQQPSLTLVNVETGQTATGAVGCANLSEFQRMAPAGWKVCGVCGRPIDPEYHRCPACGGI